MARTETIGDRLRTAKGKTGVEKLAGRSGVTARAIWLILGGQKAGPQPDTIRRLAAACGVRPGWLAYGDGEMTSNNNDTERT